MTITFYGPDAAGMNSFMCLDQGVNRFLSLYNNIVVLSSWLLMVIILLNYFIKETFSDLLSSNHGRWDTDLVGWSYFSQDFCVCSHEKMKINWSQTTEDYFCKLGIKDLKKFKRIRVFYFWTKLNEIWHILSLIYCLKNTVSL